jgi:glycine/D-amino acid oxidase-like deaminating enzyme
MIPHGDPILPSTVHSQKSKEQEEGMESHPHFTDSKHVVVIGAGVTGALLSYKLLQAGHRVTCIEARTIGVGSSSRSAACVRAQWGTEANIRAMRLSIHFYR